jgi:type I restriction enzyme S subunit
MELASRVREKGSNPDLPHVEYEDINSGEGSLNKDLSEKRSDKVGILFESGDILYGKLRPYLMNWLYPHFRGIAVGDFWVLRHTGVDSSFLYRLIQNPDFQRVANVSAGSKMPRADWKLVSRAEFVVPVDTSEQRRIGVLFDHLDHLITLHQRESLIEF